jgi:hypothetical protein
MEPKEISSETTDNKQPEPVKKSFYDYFKDRLKDPMSAFLKERMME